MKCWTSLALPQPLWGNVGYCFHVSLTSVAFFLWPQTTTGFCCFGCLKASSKSNSCAWGCSKGKPKSKGVISHPLAHVTHFPMHSNGKLLSQQWLRSGFHLMQTWFCNCMNINRKLKVRLDIAFAFDTPWCGQGVGVSWVSVISVYFSHNTVHQDSQMGLQPFNFVFSDPSTVFLTWAVNN